MVKHTKINLTEEQHYHYELMFEKYSDSTSALELMNESKKELENLEYHCLKRFDETMERSYIYIANFCRETIDFKYSNNKS